MAYSLLGKKNTRFSHAVVQIKEVMAMLDKIPEYS